MAGAGSLVDAPLRGPGGDRGFVPCASDRDTTYTNVTVTTKAKSYIFILHAGGMTSLKVAELPPDLKQKLGYAIATESKAATKTAAVWAKREIARIGEPQIKDLSQNAWKQLEQRTGGLSAARLSATGLIGPRPNWTLWESCCCSTGPIPIAAC